MSDEIFLSGKTYVSSKRAALATGYAQDYIGQLARKGLIDSQRVGGLWYVLPESLEAYKRNAEAFTPTPPVAHTSSNSKDLDTIVSFDGKDYVSSSKAARITGYNPDYIGQLARSGKILSRQVGNRWYIEREGLVTHKSQKDALLASVQAESAGLRIATPVITPVAESEDRGPHLTYIREDERHLFPDLIKPQRVRDEERQIPIRIISSPPLRLVEPVVAHTKQAHHRVGRRSGKAISVAAKAVAALTVVVVLSYGLTTLREGATYATSSTREGVSVSTQNMAASVSVAIDRIFDIVEAIIAGESVYRRAE